MFQKTLIVFFFAVWASIYASGAPLVNLQVSGSRVIGSAKGKAADKEILERMAVAKARGEADILLEPTFFHEQDGDSLLVTVTGLQARFAGGVSGVGGNENRALSSVAANEQAQTATAPQIETISPKKDIGSGMYFSLKAQTAIPWSSMGANFQVGYIQERTFWGLDFGVGTCDRDNSRTIINPDDYPYFYGGGLSFGGRVKPNEQFQAIIGAHVGVFTRFYEEEADRWLEPSGWSWSNWRYSYRRSREFVMGQGPFAKFIFGSGDIKFEVSNRLSFGRLFGTYIMEAGIVYTPTRK